MNLENTLFKMNNVPKELQVFLRDKPIRNPFKKVPVKKKRLVRKLRIELLLSGKIISLYTPTKLYSKGFLDMLPDDAVVVVENETWTWKLPI